MNSSNVPLKVLGVRSSRKKASGAIQRHFAGWKDLLYAVDTATGILIVRPASSTGSSTPIVVGLADTSVLQIPLRRITVSPHFYAPEGAHILSITCEAVGSNGDTLGGYCWLGRGSDSSSTGSNSKCSEGHTLSSSSSSSSSDQHGDMNTSDEGTSELYEKPLRHTNTTITTGQGEILKDEVEIQLRMDSENDLTTWQLALSEHIRQQQMAIDTATAVGLKAIASYLKKRLHLQSIYSLSEPFHADIQHTLSRGPFDLQPSQIPATTITTSPIKWAHHGTSRSNSIGSSSGGSVMNRGYGLNTVNNISQQYRERSPDVEKEIRDCKGNYDDDDRKRDEQEDEDDEDYLVLREEDDYSIVDHTSIPPAGVSSNHHHNHNHSILPKPTVTRFLPSSIRPSPPTAPVPLSVPSSSSMRSGISTVPGGLSARSTAAVPPLLSVDSRKCGGAVGNSIPLSVGSSDRSGSGDGGGISFTASNLDKMTGHTTLPTNNNTAHSRIRVSPRYLRRNNSAGQAPINASVNTITPITTTTTTATTEPHKHINNTVTPTTTTVPAITPSSSVAIAMSARPRPPLALARMLQPPDGSSLWTFPVPKLQVHIYTYTLLTLH